MFLLKSVVRRMFHQGKLSLILVLSIGAGFLCPIYILGHTMSIYSEIGQFSYEKPENVLILSDSRKALKTFTLRNVDAVLGDYEYSYECLQQTTAAWGDQTLITTVGGVSEDTFELSPYTLEAGRLLTAQELSDPEAGVCLVKKTSEFVSGGGQVGDTLQFMGRTFEVAGIFDSTRILASVIIPYPAIGEIAGAEQMQHRFVIASGTPWDEAAIEQMVSMLNRRGGLNVFRPMTAVEEDAEFDASIRSMAADWLMIGGAVLVFALLSVWIILMGSMMNEKYSYGIRRAVGAGTGRLFAEAFVQNLLLIILALALDTAVTAVLLVRLFPFTLLYNGAAVGIIGAAGLAAALILSVLTVVLAVRRPVCSLLLDQSGV